ncbi:MAG: PIN domain-containing protein [Anaerolineae bacterium]|nr:PIN domain-containing protein [Anaerolineae bacterium]
MIRVFFDASVLFAAAYSARGSARDLINLALQERITFVVSQQVLEETRRNLSLDYPEKAAILDRILDELNPTIIPNPTKEQVLAAAEYTALKDAPIIAAARNAGVDYLTTYDRKHLLDPKIVAEKSGLSIVTPDVIVGLFEADE